MCGRFSQTKKKQDIKKRFNLERVPENLPELYNIAPQQNAQVVLNAYPNELAFARFGLVPLCCAQHKSRHGLKKKRLHIV